MKYWKNNRFWKIARFHHLQVIDGNILAEEDTLKKFPVIRATDTNRYRWRNKMIGTEKQVVWAEKIRQQKINYLTNKFPKVEKEIERASRLDDWTGKDVASGVELQAGSLAKALQMGGLFEITDMKDPASAQRALEKSVNWCKKNTSAKYWIESNTFAVDYHVTNAIKAYVKGIKAREAKKDA